MKSCYSVGNSTSNISQSTARKISIPDPGSQAQRRQEPRSFQSRLPSAVKTVAMLPLSTSHPFIAKEWTELMEPRRVS